jgi:hypothetical protein
MALKETKRKAFQFYRSYYDVFNELSDKDKLVFIKALLDKQFLDVEPPELNGMVNFAWISQYNSIDQQVKGYKSKTKDLMDTPTEGGSTRASITPALQEEGKEEGKEEEELLFECFWDLYDKKNDRQKCEVKFNKLSQDDKDKIIAYLPAYVKATTDLSQVPSNKFRKDPATFLHNRSWENELPQTEKDVVPFVYKF